MKKPRTWGLIWIAALAMTGAGVGPTSAQISTGEETRVQPLASNPSATPASATFQSVFGSSTTPVTLKWSDLQSGWFKFVASEQTEGGVYAQLYGNLLGTNVYYTQGTTISVGSETYLVAYRPATKQMDIAELMNSYTKPPKPAPLTPETPLALCLLNVRTMGSLKEITPLDPQRESQAVDDRRSNVQEYFDHVEGERGSLVAESNLKQLGLAVLKYAQSQHETLPPLKNATQARSALFKFAKSNTLFVDPKTRQMYQPNPALSRHPLSVIPRPAEMIVYYDPSSSDGLRSVLYVDGHTRRIPDTDWPRVKRASKIP